jgi:hypothetical protein
MTAPLVVALEMGYGHLRAARPLAAALGTAVFHADREPLAGAEEQRHWRRARSLYEATSRLSQIRGTGVPLRSALEALTFIPHLHPHRDLSRPTFSARVLDRFIHRGLGGGLAHRLRDTGAPLLTTFFAPALAADRFGCENVFCVATDTDVNRVWAPLDGGRTSIRYLAPSRRVVRRLVSYGVPRARIALTGFPLPDALVGGSGLSILKRNLAARIIRLDPLGRFRDAHRDELHLFLGPLPDARTGPPLLTFAVGGAGAQSDLAQTFLPSLRADVEAGRLEVALVAGTRLDVAATFEAALHSAGLEAAIGRGVRILVADDLETYFDRFDALLARTDILWTKPSELTFYGALGIPLVFSWPVGVHERYNRRWAVEAGAGFRQRDPRHAAGWITEWLEDGVLAGGAWCGFMRLPKFGLYRILEAVREAPAGA